MAESGVGRFEAKRIGFWSLAVGVPVGAYWVPKLLDPPEALAWASTGAILELSGLLLAAFSLHAKLADVKGTPRFPERVRRFFARAWHRIKGLFGEKPEPEKQVTVGRALEHDVALPMGVLKTTSEPTCEERVEKLEQEVSEIRSDINDLRTDAREKLKMLEERLRETKRGLDEADRRLRQLVERLTVGGFEWEAVGLVWFVLGVVVSTWGPILPFL